MTVLPLRSIGRAASIDEVVTRMESITGAPPAGDDIAAFTRLYLAVTEAVRAAATAGLLEGFEAVLDVALGNLDDILAMWDVERARDAAWTNAQALQALRGASTLRNAFLDSLDRMVGFAGRGLLRPLPIAIDG